MNVALVTGAVICLMLVVAGVWVIYSPAALILLGLVGLAVVLTVAYLAGQMKRTERTSS